MAYFVSNKVKLHYYKYGYGDKILFAFHGFGMRGDQFKVLASAFEEEYTLYSFDWFFHGNTSLLDDSHPQIKKGILASEFSECMQDFIAELNIGTKKISLLSYSMGALFAWSLITCIPQQIESAFFIAPDGIKPNALLKTASQNRLLNGIFHKLVYRPKTVDFCLKGLRKFNYIDEDLFRILSREFRETQTRLICYNTITYLSKLQFNANSLIEVLNRHGIETFFYFGRKDKLFPARIGEAFTEKLKHSKLHIFEDGHELVNERLNELLKQQLPFHDKRQAE